jgi:hypothetical protein
MRLPNPERAVVDIRKIRDYCLSKRHFRGRWKATQFSVIVGLTTDDAEQMRQALLTAAASQDASASEGDEYGQRYQVQFSIQGRLRESVPIRSCWIVLTREDFPRFLTCDSMMVANFYWTKEPWPDTEIPMTASSFRDRGIEITDVVALTEDVSQRGLMRGQVGTVVEVLADGMFEVEFGDLQGIAYASVPLKPEKLMLLVFKLLKKD